MKLRLLAGMIAVMFSSQTVALENLTDEGVEYCSELHTLAVSMYQLASKKDGSALKVFALAEGDTELQTLVMAAMQASNVADRFGGLQQTGMKFAAGILKVCLTNAHEKEFMPGHITEYAMFTYPKDESDPTYQKLKKAHKDSLKRD